MALLSEGQKDEIIRRRGSKCNSHAKTRHQGKLEIHHVNGKPSSNDPSNLKVYCKKHHPAPRT